LQLSLVEEIKSLKEKHENDINNLKELISSMSSSCLPRTVIVETGEIQQPLIVESELDSFVSIILAAKTKM